MGAVRGPMAKNGLVVVAEEKCCDRVDKMMGGGAVRQHLKFTFQFQIWHSSGQSLDPVQRTVSVIWDDSQTFGKAQSYALKQYLRCQFLVATGEPDADDTPPTKQPKTKGKKGGRSRSSQKKQRDPETVKADQELITPEQKQRLVELSEEVTGDDRAIRHVADFWEFLRIATGQRDIEKWRKGYIMRTIAWLESMPDFEDWDERQKAALVAAKMANDREAAERDEVEEEPQEQVEE